MELHGSGSVYNLKKNNQYIIINNVSDRIRGCTRFNIGHSYRVWTIVGRRTDFGIEEELLTMNGWPAIGD